MKILIDMNLSPDWVEVLARHGFTTVHWSTVGDPRAEDSVIMEWARTNDHIIFTHDLDFGAMLALTQAESPSVIQVRTQDVTPAHLETMVVAALAADTEDHQRRSSSVPGAVATGCDSAPPGRYRSRY